ncbi:MAG: hypothetical protein WC966_05020, partial [Bradymonadales bacterium]
LYNCEKFPMYRHFILYCVVMQGFCTFLTFSTGCNAGTPRDAPSSFWRNRTLRLPYSPPDAIVQTVLALIVVVALYNVFLLQL